MTEQTPPQGRLYRGPITDTDRWKGFRQRKGDIFICTPAKCGTTWTQAICAMLVFGRADHGQRPGAVSPWIDADFAPIEEFLETVEAQTHRRFLKTHTPFDGIPYHRECTYLVVLRDPRDAYFSGIDHRANLTDRELAASVFPGGEQAFEIWLNHERDGESWDFWTLDAIVRFFESYWPYRGLSNVQLLHYSDMKRDLPGAVRRIARAIGAQYSEDELDSFAAAAAFESMKSKAEQFAPESGSGMWHSESSFFARGSLGRWADEWTPEQIAAFEARIDGLLAPDEKQWLLSGGPVPT